MYNIAQPSGAPLLSTRAPALGYDCKSRYNSGYFTPFTIIFFFKEKVFFLLKIMSYFNFMKYLL